ncbi:hypothetical protein L596_007940 [Steinernema carpocapsae]|uniref:Uncharacterized protein n=1 Tax=Steinernema carpocapsae TaxID=34508 RepID=A0A4U5PBH0_STECR|nr:hypothetical protein L596_007940 [Steinernema carpocapsae]
MFNHRSSKPPSTVPSPVPPSLTNRITPHYDLTAAATGALAENRPRVASCRFSSSCAIFIHSAPLGIDHILPPRSSSDLWLWSKRGHPRGQQTTSLGHAHARENSPLEAGTTVDMLISWVSGTPAG